MIRASLLTLGMAVAPWAADARGQQAGAVEAAAPLDPRLQAPLDWRPVDAWLAEGAASKRFCGAAARVVRGGEVVFDAAVGHADAEGQVPLRSDAIFRIYSMSKPITVAGALVLVERGELDLEAPVAKYLPQFADVHVLVETAEGSERVPCERPMTVRDLCRHTSGLTYGYFDNSRVDRMVLAARMLDQRTTNALLVERLAALPLKHQPGTRFEYSLSTDVLGRVIEVVSGRPLGQHLHATVFRPLGMVDTFFEVPEEDLDRVASCFTRRRGGLTVTLPGGAIDPMMRDPHESGGGGLWSTLDDYMRFCRMLLGHGALDDVRVLTEPSVEAMLTDQLAGLPAPMLRQNGGHFGLGLALQANSKSHGVRAGAAWWGGLAGTSFWIDPELDLAGVFMIQVMNEVQHASAFRRRVYDVIDD